MGRVTIKETDRMLREAEEAGKCLCVKSGPVLEVLQKRALRLGAISPMPGMYVSTETWNKSTPEERHLMVLRALHDEHREWTFCGPSAALVWGIAVPRELLKTVQTNGGFNSHWRSQWGISSHRRSSEGRVMWHGIPVTSVEQTLLDSLCWTNFRNGLAIIDSALRIGIAEKNSVEAFIHLHGRGVHGIVQARETIKHADGNCPSLECSIVRAAIWELGYVDPQLGQVVAFEQEDRGRDAHFCWKLRDGSRVILSITDKESARLEGDALIREKDSEQWMPAGRCTYVALPLEDALVDRKLDDTLFLLRVPKNHAPKVRVPPLVISTIGDLSQVESVLKDDSENGRDEGTSKPVPEPQTDPTPAPSIAASTARESPARKEETLGIEKGKPRRVKSRKKSLDYDDVAF
ncbi:MAG: hypothetical protein ACOYJL_03530 [Tractidigestivibacter sp.]|jgi:hypothetical protein|uniref:hypothetical protein n=1 Tax=Tractidigestivibacter sp. TaxID=2847320 RepID=UPI003D913F26